MLRDADSGAVDQDDPETCLWLAASIRPPPEAHLACADTRARGRSAVADQLVRREFGELRGSGRDAVQPSIRSEAAEPVKLGETLRVRIY
jgi:hypothetical protein